MDFLYFSIFHFKTSLSAILHTCTSYLLSVYLHAYIFHSIYVFKFKLDTMISIIFRIQHSFQKQRKIRTRNISQSLEKFFFRDIFNNALSKELHDTSRFIYFPRSYTKYFIKFEKMSTSSQMKSHIFQLITHATFVEKFASYDDTNTKFSSIQKIETQYSNDATPLKGNHHHWTGLTVKKSR